VAAEREVLATRHRRGGGTDGVAFLDADLTVPGALGSVTEAEAIVHAAAVLATSFERSEAAAAANEAIDREVIAVAERTGAHLLYASGTSLYGAHRDAAPVAESAALAPRGPYLEQKARAEERFAALAGGFTALRLSAPYGPGQRARTVLQLFVGRALAGKPIEYFGAGTREQDFLWTDDAADAFVRALGAPAGTYNVASGEHVSMRDLAMLAVDASGADPALVRAAGWPDPEEGLTARFDTSAARSALGWTPRTPLGEGLARLVEAART
jgi:nucleoside-diphosphate-sugar epimerase